MDFSTRLKELRYEKGLSQLDLAKDLNISRSSLCNYELGRREPSLEVLELISDYFNVDMDYLLGKSNYTTLIVNQYLRRMEAYVSRLNDFGVEKLLERAEELADMDKYKKE